MSKLSTRSPPKGPKVRYGLEFGVALRDYFNSPPYIPSGHKFGFRWTPKLLASYTKTTEAAVRQWLTGVSVPSNSMPSLIEAIFGPKPEIFAAEIEALWNLLRSAEELRDSRSRKRSLEPLSELPTVEVAPVADVGDVGDGHSRQPLIINAIQSEASVYPNQLSAEVQKISADVDKILLMLGGNNLFDRAAEAGLGKSDIAEALEGLEDVTPGDAKQTEERVLLHLLQSNFGYQREFAWDSLLYLDKLSPLAIDTIVKKALSYGKPYQADAIREILASSAEGINKIAIAESLVSHNNEALRELTINHLIRRSDKAGVYARVALEDRAAVIRLLGVQYFEQKLNAVPEIVPEFCRLLSDSDSSVCKEAARGLLSLVVDKGWEHLPLDSRTSLADALASDPSKWATVVSALSNDQAPIKDFQSLLSIVFSTTDTNMRKRILNSVPGEKERYIGDAILHLSSNDETKLIQAAYQLSYLRNIGGVGISALQAAEQSSTSVVARSALSMAIKAQDGREIPRVCQLVSDDIDQSDVYPLWVRVVTVENRRGLDVAEISKIIKYCEKFEADFYIWREGNFNEKVMVSRSSDSLFDMMFLVLAKGDKMSIGAAGPEAIVGVNSLEGYVSSF